MDICKLVDHAFNAMQNADQKVYFYPGLTPETINIINTNLSQHDLPLLPEDYLLFLAKTNGCAGHYFQLFGIDRIDHDNGIITESGFIDESIIFNERRSEDDLEDKALVVGRMYHRMIIVYLHKQYHILDEDSYLPLDALYDNIADIITETISAADARARREATEKALKKK
jgi:hypothetical protein